MNTIATAAELNKITTDLHAAKMDLGKMSIERESACHLLLLERVVRVVEALDARSRGLEVELKRLSGDGK